MSKRTRNKSKTGLIVGVGLLAATLAIVSYAVIQLSSNDPTGLSNSQNTFTVSDYVGQTAPEFTATNVDGQPYSFKLGNGRPTAIVFYMGFG